MNLQEITGSVGVFLLLLAYFLNLVKVLKASSISYGLLNTVGAGLAAYSSYLLGFWPFIILEGTWTIVSAVSLGKSLSNKARPKANI